MFLYKKYLAVFALLIVYSSAEASVSRLDGKLHIQLRQPPTPGEYVIRQHKIADEEFLLVSHAGGSCVDHPVMPPIKLEYPFGPLYISLYDCQCAFFNRPNTTYFLNRNARLRVIGKKIVFARKEELSSDEE